MKQLGGLGGGVPGDPADFGRVVAFLCSEPTRFVSGVALPVDGAAMVGLLASSPDLAALPAKVKLG